MRLPGSGRALWYAIAGVILSMGAPTGLLLLRELYAPQPVAAELLSDRLTYVYVLAATAIVLGVVGFMLGTQADRLTALSQTDALTGLPNRRALSGYFREELRRSERYGTPVSLLLIDVDGLKQVNDTEGHAAGDRLIRGVAAAILETLRETDFGARWGGDEFAIVAPNTTSDAAWHSAERLRLRVARDPGRITGAPAPRRTTLSIGFATFDPRTGKRADPERLVRAADDALYRAKASGRNRVQAA